MHVYRVYIKICRESTVNCICARFVIFYHACDMKALVIVYVMICASSSVMRIMFCITVCTGSVQLYVLSDYAVL